MDPGACPDESYGFAKRLDFCAKEIRATKPRVVLDVGCGTGELLTRPLAERFAETRFVGVDSDAASLLYARSRPRLDNLEFHSMDEMGRFTPADLIIASEVIEHVEDPEGFLLALRGALASGGRVILTLPNGFGPFEASALLQATLWVSGLPTMLRMVKQRRSRTPVEPAGQASLALSPHINFFSYRAIRSLFERMGLTIVAFRPRTLLCGFGWDRAVAALGIASWNARIADRLPAAIVSDWMFVLQASGAPVEDGRVFQRSCFARFRGALNERALQVQRGRN